MATITCPACGKAKLEIKELHELKTEFEGVSITVPNAEFSECPACGENTYTAKELKRWAEIKQATLAETGALPNGNDVKEIRERMGLSVAQFADLIAVTRQTVHSWERALDQPMKLGPATLILNLLKQEQCGQSANIASCLTKLATMRGKSIDFEPLNTSREGSGDAGRSVALRPSRPGGCPDWKRAA